MKQMPNWKRRLIKAAIIVPCSFALFLGVVVLTFWIEGQSLKYVDSLRGYDLKPILGKPSAISSGEFANIRNTISLEAGDRLVNILPSDIPEGGAEFFYFAETVKPNRSWLDRHELYLSCDWSSELFNHERERLTNIMTTGQRKPALLSEDLFPFPAIVFIYSPGTFKYVLFDESIYRVHYVYLNEIGSIKNVVFDSSLAPRKRLQDSDAASQAPFGNFSVYQ